MAAPDRISGEDLAARLMERLEAMGCAGQARILKGYMKTERRYLGVKTPPIEKLAREALAEFGDGRAAVAAGALWRSDVFEARILAAKLLTVPRFHRLDEAWALVGRWKEDFDSWAIADCVAKAGARCLRADPALLGDVEGWTRHSNMWVRRAALVFTLDWTRKGYDLERMLGWAESLLGDRQWFIHKAIGWWLRELSKHDPARVRAFLAAHEAQMLAVARREASKYLK